ncbi:MAG: hypothetical protein AAGK37_07960 [Pseudomonadota bacterium]
MRAYTVEANRLERLGETDAAMFFLTHAYIWALDGGLPEANALHARLREAGREV